MLLAAVKGITFKRTGRTQKLTGTSQQVHGISSCEQFLQKLENIFVKGKNTTSLQELQLLELENLNLQKDFLRKGHICVSVFF